MVLVSVAIVVVVMVLAVPTFVVAMDTQEKEDVASVVDVAAVAHIKVLASVLLVFYWSCGQWHVRDRESATRLESGMAAFTECRNRPLRPRLSGARTPGTVHCCTRGPRATTINGRLGHKPTQ